MVENSSNAEGYERFGIPLILAVIAGLIITGLYQSIPEPPDMRPYERIISSLQATKPQDLVVLADSSMRHATAVNAGRQVIYLRECRKSASIVTTKPDELKQIVRIVYGKDPDYKALRAEYIARCLMDGF